jgi:hypothetical protein
VEYPIDENNGGHVKYFLAPKIDEGDDDLDEMEDA